MPEITNCPRCGKIFAKSFRDVCHECYKQEENDFQTVYQFVRKKENRMATIHEVEAGTGVKEEIIIKFIKSGRIHVSLFPNLSYPCESCGRMIREGRICSVCKDNITGGLERERRERDFAERKRKEEKAKNTTYYSLKHNKK